MNEVLNYNDIPKEVWKLKRCVYCWTNTINNKKYIGQINRKATDLRARYSGHKYRAFSEFNKDNNTYNYHFYSSLRKYGINNFTLEVLFVPDKDIEDATNLLNEMEIFYINKYNTQNIRYGYNKADGGSKGNTMANKTEEEIQEWKNKIRTSQKETYAKKGKREISDETRNKLSEANKGENNGMYGTGASYVATNKKTGEVLYFKTLSDACSYGFVKTHILACCRGTRKSHKGYYWSSIK